MVKTLLAYGDSNTHGYPPMSERGVPARYGPDVRWPSVMARGLGDGWDVIAEGLPGRTTCLPDPLMGSHMDGAEGLKIALASHRPLDLLLIMLGTNDLKARFNPTADKIAAGVATLLDLALHPDQQVQHGGFEVLVIAPPPVRIRGILAGEFFGAEEVALGVAPVLESLATARGARFFDAGSLIETSDVDGVHFEPEAHRILGGALAKTILSF